MPSEATHYITRDGETTFYRKTPAPNLNLILLERWTGSAWEVMTGGPIPWSDLAPI